MSRRVFTPDDPAVLAAVGWWKKVLEDPKFDNGDSGGAGGFAPAMAKMGRKRPSEEQLNQFGESLARLLSEQMNKSRGGQIVLAVDYHPGPVLSHAASEAGLPDNLSTFPWKTVMWVTVLDPVSVIVRYGYDGEKEVVHREAANAGADEA